MNEKSIENHSSETHIVDQIEDELVNKSKRDTFSESSKFS